MRKTEISIGQKFNKLTAVDWIRNTKAAEGQRMTFYCECGIKTIKRVSDVVIGKIKSCGCSQSSIRNKHSNWTGHEELYGSHWKAIIVCAKKRKLAFSITIQEAWAKLIAQDRKCALSGLPLTLPTRSNMSNGTASLDRIDSSKGYLINNIQWVDKRINKMKMELSDSEFIELCQTVTRHNSTVLT